MTTPDPADPETLPREAESSPGAIPGQQEIAGPPVLPADQERFDLLRQKVEASLALLDAHAARLCALSGVARFSTLQKAQYGLVAEWRVLRAQKPDPSICDGLQALLQSVDRLVTALSPPEPVPPRVESVESVESVEPGAAVAVGAAGQSRSATPPTAGSLRQSLIRAMIMLAPAPLHLQIEFAPDFPFADGDPVALAARTHAINRAALGSLKRIQWELPGRCALSFGDGEQRRVVSASFDAQGKVQLPLEYRQRQNPAPQVAPPKHATSRRPVAPDRPRVELTGPPSPFARPRVELMGPPSPFAKRRVELMGPPSPFAKRRVELMGPPSPFAKRRVELMGPPSPFARPRIELMGPPSPFARQSGPGERQGRRRPRGDGRQQQPGSPGPDGQGRGPLPGRGRAGDERRVGQAGQPRRPQQERSAGQVQPERARPAGQVQPERARPAGEVEQAGPPRPRPDGFGRDGDSRRQPQPWRQADSRRQGDPRRQAGPGTTGPGDSASRGNTNPQPGAPHRENRQDGNRPGNRGPGRPRPSESPNGPFPAAGGRGRDDRQQRPGGQGGRGGGFPVNSMLADKLRAALTPARPAPAEAAPAVAAAGESVPNPDAKIRD